MIGNGRLLIMGSSIFARADLSVCCEAKNIKKESFAKATHALQSTQAVFAV